MSEMVERVARALNAADSDGLSGEPCSWDELLPHWQGQYLAMACAAIQAMRSHKLVFREDGEVVHEVRGEPNAVWQTFLDAALNEAKSDTADA